ncbi:MAG: hypothetical protein KC455_08145 [Carnobacterium sp.]|nr:hypothetical protein [Carnobacterium sp.]
MKKLYLVVHTLLFFVLVGCDSITDETIFVKGNEFYTGSTKEKLEENSKMNRPSKLVVVSDSYFTTSSIVEMGEKDKNVVNELLQVRDYRQKNRIKVTQHTILLNVLQMEIK